MCTKSPAQSENHPESVPFCQLRGAGLQSRTGLQAGRDEKHFLQAMKGTSNVDCFISTNPLEKCPPSVVD
nr:MAG TPA_asm: hypothetical protein [Caudoviricetes sp.]